MNIIEMAKEAGFNCLLPDEAMDMIGGVFEGDNNITKALERFAALVRAERKWVDLTDDAMWDVFISEDWTGEPLHLMSAVVAAFKEKNK